MQIIGHRGAAGVAPENTIEGFKKAIELGVDWVEFDVHLSKDGVPVVIHDAETARIAKENIKVSETNYDDVTEVDTLSGDKIPSLQEVVAVLAGKTKLLIELKSEGSAEKTFGVIKILLDKGVTYNDIMVSSFNSKYLQKMNSLDPKIKISLIHGMFPLKFLFSNLPLYAVAFKYNILTKKIIDLAKSKKLFTYAYTVNDKHVADRLGTWGLDAVCTDYPEFVKD